MSKSPLQHVKEMFGEKSKLVEALKAFGTEDLWVSRVNSKKGLELLSNSQLIRLHGVFTAVKSEFGSRAKLIDAIVESEKRGKDEGYRHKLSAYPVPRLYDLYKSSKKRASAHKPAPAAPAQPAG